MSRTGKRIDRATVVRVAVVVAAVALVAVIGYRQVRRVSAGEGVAWTATADLAAGDQVEPSALVELRAERSKLPPDVLLDRSRIEGRTLERRKTAGTVFREADFRPPPPLPPGLAEMVPPGRVMLTVEPSNFRPIEEIALVLRLGDRFDILAVRPGRSVPPTAVARDVVFLAWMEPRPAGGGAQNEDEEDGGGGLFASFQDLVPSEIGGGTPAGPTPLLVGVYPEHVASLTQAQADRVFLFFVLHGREEVKSGELLPVGESIFRPVELIAGGRRQVNQVQR